MDGTNIGSIYFKLTADTSDANNSLAQFQQNTSQTSQQLQNADKSTQSFTNSVNDSSISLRQMNMAFSAMIITGGMLTAAVGAAGKSLVENFTEGQQAVDQMDGAFTNVKAALGTDLIPVFQQLADAVVPYLDAIAVFIQENPTLIDQFVTTAAEIGGIVLAVGVAGKAFVDFQRISGLVIDAISGIGDASLISMTSVGLLAAIVAVAIGEQIVTQVQAAAASFGDMAQAALNSFGATDDAATKTANRIAQINDEIKKETESYDEQVAKIIESKEDELAKTEAELEKETTDFQQSQATKLEAFQKSQAQMEDQQNTAMNDLEKSLSESLVVGSKTYDQDLQNYKDKVLNEQNAQADQLATAQAAYQTDVANAQSAESDKIAAYQDTINADTTLLNNHADMVKQVDKQTGEDELTILQRNHDEKMTQLKNQLGQENDTTMAKFQDSETALQKYATDHPISLDINLGTALESLGTQIGDFISQAGAEVAVGLTGIVGQILMTFFHQLRTGLGDTVSNALGLPSESSFDASVYKMDANAVNGAKNANLSSTIKMAQSIQFASGTNFAPGGTALVGENGPELVNLPRGSQVIPNSQINKAGANITNYNQFNYPEDLTVFNQRLAYQLKIN